MSKKQEIIRLEALLKQSDDNYKNLIKLCENIIDEYVTDSNKKFIYRMKLWLYKPVEIPAGLGINYLEHYGILTQPIYIDTDCNWEQNKKGKKYENNKCNRKNLKKN